MTREWPRSIALLFASIAVPAAIVSASVSLVYWDLLPDWDFKQWETAEQIMVAIAVLGGLIPIVLQRWPLHWRALLAVVYVPAAWMGALLYDFILASVMFPH